MIKTVKYTFAALVAVALATIASAQITPRPATWASAGQDGLNSFLSPLDAVQKADFSAAGVNIVSDGTVSLPSGFILGTPTLALNPLGGSVQVMFLGETAGWRNDLGYVLNPSSANLSNPAVYNPLVVNLQGFTSGTPANGTLVMNTFADVNYAAGQTLDFFLNGVGDPSQNNGGTWFTFGTPNQFSGTDSAVHTKYTYLTIEGVSTLVVAYEDSRLGTKDGDYSDVILAFQGTGIPNPVPEPSTYGLVGAAAMLAIVGLRRFKR
jgi:hypothetical protein